MIRIIIALLIIGCTIVYAIVKLILMIITSLEKNDVKREKMVDKAAFEKTLERLANQLKNEQR